MATATAFFASDADRAQLIAQPEQFVARAETVLGGLVERLKRLEAERAAERVDAEQVHHQHERAHATLRDEHQKLKAAHGKLEAAHAPVAAAREAAEAEARRRCLL